VAAPSEASETRPGLGCWSGAEVCPAAGCGFRHAAGPHGTYRVHTKFKRSLAPVPCHGFSRSRRVDRSPLPGIRPRSTRDDVAAGRPVRRGPKREICGRGGHLGPPRHGGRWSRRRPADGAPRHGPVGDMARARQRGDRFNIEVGRPIASQRLYCTRMQFVSIFLIFISTAHSTVAARL
jgi:hypothetical protein